jgi:hypothetical protein
MWSQEAREASALARAGHKQAQALYAAHQTGVVKAITPSKDYTKSFNRSLGQSKGKSPVNYVPMSRVGSHGQILHS